MIMIIKNKRRKDGDVKEIKNEIKKEIYKKKLDGKILTFNRILPAGALQVKNDAQAYQSSL